MKTISTLELSQRILDMAESGVYRELILEALHPLATKKQIRSAIAQARHYGLYSVPELRDPDLGTYYQRDPKHYQSLQRALRSSIPLSEQPLPEQIRQTTITIRRMLGIAAGCSLVSSLGGISCLVLQHTQLGWGLLVCSSSLAGVWGLQRGLAYGMVRSSHPGSKVCNGGPQSQTLAMPLDPASFIRGLLLDHTG